MKHGRMRIAYVIGELAMGGLERQLSLLLSQLDRRHIEPIVIAHRERANDELASEIRAMDIATYILPKGGGALRRLSNLRAQIQQLTPDYIHSYSFMTNFSSWFAGNACSAKGVIGSIRSDYYNDILDTGHVRGRLCAGFPGAMIANSAVAMQNALADKHPLRPHRVWHVPNAVDTHRFCPPMTRRNDSTIRLLGVGRLQAEKRWGWLISLFAKFKAPTRRAWRFDICGEGPEREKLARLITQLGLQEHVYLLGQQPAIMRQLQNSDLLILASQYEGSPNVVAEAMSCGIPVLATRVGSVPNLICHGKNGMIVDVNDQESFLFYLGQMVEGDKRRREMGHLARESMVATRSPEKLVENTLRAYEEAGFRVA